MIRWRRAHLFFDEAAHRAASFVEAAAQPGRGVATATLRMLAVATVARTGAGVGQLVGPVAAATATGRSNGVAGISRGMTALADAA